jgi:hypothetical protein
MQEPPFSATCKTRFITGREPKDSRQLAMEEAKFIGMYHETTA